MHIILTGATGLVGSATLVALLGMKDIAKISILSRRPVPMLETIKDDRLEVIIHKDFEKYSPDLLQHLKGANGCVWALGVSQNDVSQEEYIRITKSFTLEAAQAFSKLRTDSETFKFVFVSGEGATWEPGRLTPVFSRVKGETEIALTELGKKDPRLSPIIVRPAWVDSNGHREILPWAPQLPRIRRYSECVLGPALRTAFTSYQTPTKPLGELLVGLAMGSWDKRLVGNGVTGINAAPIVSNVGIRRLMGLS